MAGQDIHQNQNTRGKTGAPLRHTPNSEVSGLVNGLRVIWVALHLIVPVYATYFGVGPSTTGLSDVQHKVLMGSFWLVALLIFFMLIVLFPKLPSTVSGMLGLVLGPLSVLALGHWAGSDFTFADYVTECGVAFTITTGLGFGGVVLLGSVVAGKEGPGLAATLAQCLFLVPFGWALYVFGCYLWQQSLAADGVGGVLAAIALLAGVAWDTAVSFRRLLAESIYG